MEMQKFNGWRKSISFSSLVPIEMNIAKVERRPIEIEFSSKFGTENLTSNTKNRGNIEA